MSAYIRKALSFPITWMRTNLLDLVFDFFTELVLLGSNDDVVLHLDNLLVSAFIATRKILADNLKCLEQCQWKDVLLGVVNLQLGHGCEICENTNTLKNSMIEKTAIVLLVRFFGVVLICLMYELV